jgi:hypothetical protein
MGAKSGVSFKNLAPGIIPLKLKPNLQIQLWRILPYTRLKFLNPGIELTLLFLFTSFLFLL